MGRPGAALTYGAGSGLAAGRESALAAGGRVQGGSDPGATLPLEPGSWTRRARSSDALRGLLAGLGLCEPVSGISAPAPGSRSQGEI